MDYTPGAMTNYTKDSFKATWWNAGSQGTRSHQLAMYVIYLSPLQMLADTPMKYRKYPDSMIFLGDVPATWDETVALKAEVGKVVAMARRKGDKWYIGAINNWEAREIEVSLDFLKGGQYKMTSWSDGPNIANDAKDCLMADSKVTANSKIKIKLAAGGGYVAIIKK